MHFVVVDIWDEDRGVAASSLSLDSPPCQHPHLLQHLKLWLLLLMSRHVEDGECANGQSLTDRYNGK